ncbi:MAG: hypothetical protein IPJ38_16030 [Dechloromonas sp.]|uniref:Peptidase C-terminal archaeal/bacterial domain-containing protein n=1 Tax=Candidatus Dechloromonas phosphorivorans TaxID=2899244 RepID=A0A935JZ64_9RHOO|nr:hypothetical protein [Candidatus Dechloromonas phosphorivorans]
MTNIDDYSDTTASSGRLNVGGTLSGRIEAVGDRDAVAVTLQAGQTYEIRMTSRPARPLPVPARCQWQFLLADDDSGGGRNAMLTYKAPMSGTYYVLARDYANGTGTYQLAASTVTPAGSAYSIDVRYEGDAQYRSYFDAAAQRWAQVITGDLPDMQDSRFGRIDDLLIEASVVSIDGAGSILGQAG